MEQNKQARSTPIEISHTDDIKYKTLYYLAYYNKESKWSPFKSYQRQRRSTEIADTQWISLNHIQYFFAVIRHQVSQNHISFFLHTLMS